MSYTQRVQDRAIQIPVVKLLLSLISIPFYVLGFLIAVLWLCLAWICSAFLTGWADAKHRAKNHPQTPTEEVTADADVGGPDQPQ